MNEEQLVELLKSGYSVEFRFLNYDPTKDPIFNVSIKKFNESEKRMEVLAKGYDKEGIKIAFDKAYKLFRDINEN